MRIVILISLLFLSCNLKKTWVDAKITYAEDEFMNGRMTVESGNSLVVTPLVYEGRFLDIPSPELLAKPLESRHDYLKPLHLDEFTKSLDSEASSLLSLWREALLHDDILKMGEYTPLFRRNEVAFIITFKLTFLANVKGTDGTIMRRVKLRSELWGSKERKVIFRAESELKTFQERYSDKEVLLLAIKELYHLLPKFYFNTIHESW